MELEDLKQKWNMLDERLSKSEVYNKRALEEVIKGKNKTTYEKLQKQGTVRLVDVREEESYKKGHIPEAVSIPYSEEQDFLEKFEKAGTIVICCDRGNLSAKVTLRMRKAGYPAYSLAGGYEGYRRFQK